MSWFRNPRRVKRLMNPAILAALSLSGAAHANAANRVDLTLCERLAIQASRLPDAAWAKGDKALEPFVAIDSLRPTDTVADKATTFENSLARLPEVQNALQGDNGTWSTFMDHLAGTDIYTASIFAGTLHCQDSVFIKAQPHHAARLVDGPARFGEGDVCWMTSAAFGRALDRPALIIHDFIGPATEKASFAITPWTGRAWGRACEFGLQFRANYALTKRVCGDAVVCRVAEKTAYDAALSYNRLRETGGDLSLFPMRFDHSKDAQAAVERAKVKLEPAGTPDFPGFGLNRFAIPTYSYVEFELLPLELDGKVYVGAVGHEGVGWRENENTLFAIYSENDGALTPLAGYVITRSLAGLAAVTIDRKPDP